MSLNGVSSEYSYDQYSLLSALSGFASTSNDQTSTTESTSTLDFATISQEAMAEYEASQQRVGGNGSNPPPPPPPPPSGGKGDGVKMELFEDSDYSLYNEENMFSNPLTANSSTFYNSLQTRIQLLGNASNSLIDKAV